MRHPQQATARLYFDASEIVVLELCPEGQSQLVRNGDLVLYESAEQLKIARQRLDANAKAVARVVARQTIAESPGDRLPGGKAELVLNVEVERIAILAQSERVTRGSVVVQLQRGGHSSEDDADSEK